MKRRDDDDAAALLRLADSVNDRTPVDWDHEGEESPTLASRLRRLKSLETIASAYRTAGVASPDPIAADSEGPTGVLFHWGHLQAVEPVGQGSYGQVYRAWDPRLARYVALKLWPATTDAGAVTEDDPAVRRFVAEARRLARVRHPNVLAIHGADIHDGRPGLWAEFLSGETLDTRIRGGERLGAEEAVVVGVGLSRALAALHGAGLVHGDLKAANVLREEGGRVVLLDFGSARELNRPGSEEPESISGTPLAMSAEVLRGEAPTAADDVYSLGALLFRLTTGRYPFEARSHEALLAQHERGERLRLRDLRPDLPPAFVALVERALAPDRRERPRSAAAFEAELWNILRDDGASPRHAPRRGLPLGWLAAAALLVVVAGVALKNRPDREPGAPPTMVAPALEMEASLFRAGDDLTERLQNGQPVAPGDRLFLEIEGTRAFHAYVLDEDQAGNLFVLYPVTGLEPGNPLPAGLRHRLPGSLDGVAQEWQVTSAGGRETVLIVASERPLPLLEGRIASLPKAEPGQPPVYAELNPEALEELRGIAGLVPAGPATPPAPGGRLADLAANLEANRPTTAGLWIRRIELSNP